MNNIKIKQAVILAGGRGERLRPITDSIPKPMIEFHGKPFLEYLIEMLKEQGFTEVLLLLGYLPDQIENYFGNGERWNIKISYSKTNVENDTGLRIKLAEDLINDTFLLMYCDNYWPMQYDKMLQQFIKIGKSALVTVYRNSDNYTKNNLRINDDKLIEIYDKTRTSQNLQGVDIGFFIFKKEVLKIFPKNKNVNFEKTVFPILIKNQQISAYVTDHRYYSVGSYERLKVTKEFLLRKPTILLDRDGVINKKAPKTDYVKNWSEWEWIKGSKEAICLLKKNGYRIIIISNQAGIARGKMTVRDLDDIHIRMINDIQKCGGEIDRIYYCPHGWDDNCECRKPKPGMIFQAQRDYHLDLSRLYFIGDDERDKQAGDAAGCKTILINQNENLYAIVKKRVLEEE